MRGDRVGISDIRALLSGAWSAGETAAALDAKPTRRARVADSLWGSAMPAPRRGGRMARLESGGVDGLAPLEARERATLPAPLVSLHPRRHAWEMQLAELTLPW